MNPRGPGLAAVSAAQRDQLTDADPHALLGHPTLATTLDDTRPVAVMLVSMLMYFTDDEVQRLIAAIVEAMPPGSVLTVSHPITDFDPDAVGAAVAAARHRGMIYRPRTRHRG